MSETKKPMSGAARRQEEYLKARKDKNKLKLITVSVIVVLALLFAGAMFLNSKYIRRTMPAVDIDGVKFTAAEYDYFFTNAYYEYQTLVYQSAGDYASSMLPSSGTPLSSQVYDTQTGETWADFFAERAIDTMVERAQFYNAAIAAGFTLPDEAGEQFEKELAQMKENAPQYGYSSFNAYLRAIYGVNMNESALRKVAELVNLADSYGKHVTESFEYTPDELSSYYAENKDTFDLFTFRYMLIKPETLDEADFETTEEYEAATAEALAEAVSQAESIATGIKTQQDFIDAAREYDSATYSDDDSTLRNYKGDLLGAEYGDWLRDSARKPGDVTTAEISTGCYVVYFDARSGNEYNMASMRQILITPEAVYEDAYEDSDEYANALDAATQAAKEKADTALSLFIEKGATEDALLELMPEYSSDTTEGGYYENIAKSDSSGGMVPEIDSWLFDPARKTGDYELIHSESYGYHLVYFTGYGDRYCDYLAKTALREDDFEAWKETLPVASVNYLWAYRLKSQ